MGYYKPKPAIKMGWLRALLFAIAFGLFMVISSYAVAPILDLIGTSQHEQNITFYFVFTILNLILIGGLLFVFMRFVDREPIGNLGLRFKGHKLDIFTGLFWSGLMITAGAFVLGKTAHIEFFPSEIELRYLLLNLLLFLLVAVFEEVVFRGYLLKNLMQSMPPLTSLALSSLLFAAIHLKNPSIDVVGFLNLILGGIFLGIAYIFTKNIYMAIGLHWGWNFFQGSIWGFEVSGHNFESLWLQEILKDNLFSGGDFGFEGSILASIILAVTCVAFYIYYNNKYGKKSL